MTYTQYESSTESGSPIELYTFGRGLTAWRYTTSASQIVWSGQVFEPAPITRGAIKHAGGASSGSLRIVLPRDNLFAAGFLGLPPDAVTTVTVYRGHAADPDMEYVVYWRGRVVGTKIDGNTVDIECQSIFTALSRPGLRAKYSLTCGRHVIYGHRCGVNREAYKVAGVVSSISASRLVIGVSGAGTFPAGYFTGGIFAPPATVGATGFITAHSGELVTLSNPIQGLTVGMPVDIYPGCDHKMSTCLEKFNNLNNFGGFPFIPPKNPFGGTSIV